jgi:hypothetical protein
MNIHSDNTPDRPTPVDAFEPVTGEHRLRPPVSLENEPPSSVPSWEPEVGDFS